MARRSTIYLLVMLTALSIAIIGAILGCDEKKVTAPVVGPGAGSGPIGGGEAQELTLTANPSETVTAVGNEQAKVKITALVENTLGQPMPDGTAVYWTATYGTLDSTVTTTTNGASSVSLTFENGFSGSSTITATAGDASGSITVNVLTVMPTPTMTPEPTTAPPSKTFIVTAEKSRIKHEETSAVTALVQTDGQAEKDKQVTFVALSGGILNASAAVTDVTGKAQVTFTGNNTGETDITATINASTSDGRSGTISIIVIGGATPTPTPEPEKEVRVLTSDPDATISIAGCICIRAFATIDGEPEQNVSIEFSVSGTAAGKINPSSERTEADGYTTFVTYIPDNLGQVTIKATRLDTGAENTLTMYVK